MLCVVYFMNELLIFICFMADVCDLFCSVQGRNSGGRSEQKSYDGATDMALADLHIKVRLQL